MNLTPVRYAHAQADLSDYTLERIAAWRARVTTRPIEGDWSIYRLKNYGEIVDSLFSDTLCVYRNGTWVGYYV